MSDPITSSFYEALDITQSYPMTSFGTMICCSDTHLNMFLLRVKRVLLEITSLDFTRLRSNNYASRHLKVCIRQNRI